MTSHEEQVVNIANYCSIDGAALSFSREQASHFAKQIAGDFNPIHNVDYKRFCVPGDLLFAVMLSQFGVAPEIKVSFDGMVNDSTVLTLPTDVGRTCTLSDAKDRHFLTIDYSAQPTLNPEFVSRLIEQYVKFSGQTFPDILVELMRNENAMINPNRPLVIYKEMMLQLDQLDGENVSVVFDEATLTRDEKKGEAKLRFSLSCDGEKIGEGQKVMLLGGLREFDESAMESIIAEYIEARNSYQTSAS